METFIYMKILNQPIVGTIANKMKCVIYNLEGVIVFDRGPVAST